jgi:hypothetical protein
LAEYARVPPRCCAGRCVVASLDAENGLISGGSRVMTTGLPSRVHPSDAAAAADGEALSRMGRERAGASFRDLINPSVPT